MALGAEPDSLPHDPERGHLGRAAGIRFGAAYAVAAATLAQKTVIQRADVPLHARTRIAQSVLRQFEQTQPPLALGLAGREPFEGFMAIGRSIAARSSAGAFRARPCAMTRATEVRHLLARRLCQATQRFRHVLQIPSAA
jgi:hypothetical protein